MYLPEKKRIKERRKQKTNIQAPTMCQTLMKRIMSNTTFTDQGPGPEVWQSLPKVKARLEKLWPILNVLHLTNQCL